MAGNILLPDYKFDDCKADFKIKLMINDLKTKTFSSKPDGAIVDEPRFTDRSAGITVTIAAKGKKAEMSYGFFIELPLEIIPSKSKHDVEKGKITLTLRKADPDKNWESYVDDMTPTISDPNTG